ncbi:probable G-protein coupled receptor 148 [Osmerus eperlanus]|uniref:probable G-protein coupled receptor 148 n=1 Tax=Osmerus eperlanus TaxID=29151 RepID=UPI002E136E71
MSESSKPAMENGGVDEALSSMMGKERNLVLSVLCTFGSWYNRSGSAERHYHTFSHTNSSDRLERQREHFAREWNIFLPPRHTRAVKVCPILAFIAALLVVPVILGKILTSPRMRQETRYLLLANSLLSDMLFLSVYMLNSCVIAAGVLMSQWTCATILFLMGALYSVGILSTMAMVLDTLLAVLVPLRYLALWPVSRTRQVVVCIWAVSVLFPAASVGVYVWYHSTTPCSHHICSLPLLLVLTVSHSTPLQASMLLTVTIILLILFLAFSGYLALYCHTHMSGVWRGERSNRAKGTFLIHYLHLFLSFCPMLVLVIELLIYSFHSPLDLQADLWVSLVVCNVLLVLPKALAPYLYGLRYRDLRAPLHAFYSLRRPTSITPIV